MTCAGTSEVHRRAENGVVVIAVAGMLDEIGASRVRDLIEEIGEDRAKPQRIRVDLCKVTQLTSEGVRIVALCAGVARDMGCGLTVRMGAAAASPAR